MTARRDRATDRERGAPDRSVPPVPSDASDRTPSERGANEDGDGPGTRDGRPTAARVAAAVERTRRDELETALARLDARGSLTDDQRAVLRELSERLTEELLGEALDRLDDPGTPAPERTTVAELLVDPDGEQMRNGSGEGDEDADADDERRSPDR